MVIVVLALMALAYALLLSHLHRSAKHSSCGLQRMVDVRGQADHARYAINDIHRAAIQQMATHTQRRRSGQ